jgi:hypothetical protein
MSSTTLTSQPDLTRAIPRSRQLWGVTLTAIPFVALAVLTTKSGFVANEHGRAVTNVLVSEQFGNISQRVLEMPPLISVLTVLHPTLFFLRCIAAVSAGVMVWVTWRQVREAELPSWVSTVIVAAVALSPALLFQSSTQISEMIAVTCVLLSWRYYTRFVYLGVTWNGFAAGLLLGLAFFANFASAFFVVPFALAAPASLLKGEQLSRSDRWRADIAGILVIGFPALFALTGWVYVDWTFTGSPFSFLGDPAGPFSLYDDVSIQSTIGVHDAIGQIPGDLWRAPLYPLIGVLLWRRGLRVVVAYCFPVVLVTLIRSVGVPFSESFAITSYLGFALVSLVAMFARPLKDASVGQRHLVIFVVLAFATLQIAVDFFVPMRSNEATTWYDSVIDRKQTPTEASTKALGSVLRTQPAGSILADDATTFRIIAYGGTVKPFVLPTNARFEPAVSQPQQWVNHILIPTQPDGRDRLYQRFSGDVPGFYDDLVTPDWRVLTRDGAQSLRQ